MVMFSMEEIIIVARQISKCRENTVSNEQHPTEPNEPNGVKHYVNGEI